MSWCEITKEILHGRSDERETVYLSTIHEACRYGDRYAIDALPLSDRLKDTIASHFGQSVGISVSANEERIWLDFDDGSNEEITFD